MPEQLIQLNSRKPVVIVITSLMICLAAVWSVFVVKWYIGDTLAEYFDVDENRVDVANFAVSFAPNDPLTHWRLGDYIEKKMPPDQINQAVNEYEKAVNLSPNDYRFWLSLGRSLEQAGDTSDGEKAFKRAVDLAPSYAYPHWYLGNLLLRNDRYKEGFSELQFASEADPDLRAQLFNLAWEVYKDDFDSLKSAAGTSPGARAQFAEYLVGRDRVADGLKLWEELNDTQQLDNRPVAESIITKLVAAHRFLDAATVWSDIAPGPGYRATEGKIIDNGFEDNLTHGQGTVFGWQVQSVQQAQISIDPNTGHGSARSLRMNFQVRASIDLGVSQTVLVRPSSQYEIEFYLKTQKLESAGTPVVLISDGADGGTLGASSSAPTGNNDWQRVSFNFKTGPKTEAVVLRIGRASCEENAVCPMFGTIWYDDFNLKLIS